MKPLPVQLLPVATCILHGIPWEVRASVVFVAALEVQKYCDEVLTKPSSL